MRRTRGRRRGHREQSHKEIERSGTLTQDSLIKHTEPHWLFSSMF